MFKFTSPQLFISIGGAILLDPCTPYKAQLPLCSLFSPADPQFFTPWDGPYVW